MNIMKLHTLQDQIIKVAILKFYVLMYVCIIY